MLRFAAPRCFVFAIVTMFAMVSMTVIAAQPADDWPQWLGPQRDGVWRETGILETFPKDGPKIAWRTPIGGGYAGPAVAGDRVFVTDRVLAEGAMNPADSFSRAKVEGKERVLCLDAKSGKIVWTHEYDCTYKISYPAGPRTTPLVSGGKVYTLGAMGDLLCLDADKGKVLWSKNFPKDYKAPIPMWGCAAHPLLDGNRLICLVGGEDSAVVAFDKDSGKELWRSLSVSEIGYCPPTLIEVGGKRQLIIWTPDAVHSLEPETGKPFWEQSFKIGAHMTIPTPRLDGNSLFLTAFYSGAMMLKLDKDKPEASVVWKSKSTGEKPGQTDALHCVMSTPFIKDGYIYGVCSYGELRCLKADTGERVWMSLKATGDKEKPEERWANAFLIPQGDRVFLFNEKGDLIIARLTPKGYEEISRAHILEPTGLGAGRPVVWSHPAFAHKCMFARNDKEIVCVSLAKE
jgi:outer membrane protein assembly factor BamB